PEPSAAQRAAPITLARRRARGCASLNHLVGTKQNFLWNAQTNRLGGIQVDEQLELDGLLDRQVSGLCAFEDLVNVGCRAPIEIGIARSISDETAGLDVLPGHINHRQPMLDGVVRDRLSVRLGQSIYSYRDSLNALARGGRESRTDVFGSSHIEAF